MTGRLKGTIHKNDNHLQSQSLVDVQPIPQEWPQEDMEGANALKLLEQSSDAQQELEELDLISAFAWAATQEDSETQA